MTKSKMTREQLIAKLVEISNQWGMRGSKGQKINAAYFANATDQWLVKQVQRMYREGARCATHQS